MGLGAEQRDSLRLSLIRDRRPIRLRILFFSTPMDSFLIAIASLLPLLVVLVVVHEFGHFATARAMGVKVLEFGIGFPPRAFGIYTGRTPVLTDGATLFAGLPGPQAIQPGMRLKVSSAEDADGNLLAKRVEAAGGRREHEANDGPRFDDEDLLKHEGKVRAVAPGSFVLADMLYSVNLMPLGGFVRLAGESNPNVPRSLASKGVGARLLVLAAGPFMNAILPIAIFTILLMIPQEVVVGRLTVSEVGAGTAAADSQIQEGDIILSANGRQIESRRDFAREVNLNGGSRMELLVQRGDEEQLLFVNPRFDADAGRWLVGVVPQLVESRVETRSEPIWKAVPRSFVDMWEMLVLLKQSLGGAISQGSAPELSGPVGIAQVTGEITRQAGLTGWLGIGILLSINLAILNILPIPMLDGGRIVFVALEWVRRGKRVPPEKEGLVHMIGLAVLLAGIVIITAKDINRLLEGRSFLG